MKKNKVFYEAAVWAGYFLQLLIILVFIATMVELMKDSTNKTEELERYYKQEYVEVEICSFSAEDEITTFSSADGKSYVVSGYYDCDSPYLLTVGEDDEVIVVWMPTVGAVG